MLISAFDLQRFELLVNLEFEEHFGNICFDCISSTERERKLDFRFFRVEVLSDCEFPTLRWLDGV